MVMVQENQGAHRARDEYLQAMLASSAGVGKSVATGSSPVGSASGISIRK
jgi:hypothetical protein